MDSSKGIAGIHYSDENSFNLIVERLKKTTGTDSDRALAAALGMKPAAVSVARRRHQIPAVWIIEAVIRFNASDHHLIFGHQKNAQVPNDYYELPVLPSALLPGDELKSFEAKEICLFKRSWLERMGRPERLHLLRVKGNAMEPLIQDKDLVLVNTDLNSIQADADIYAVSFDSVVSIKYIIREPGKLILRAENSKLAPDVVIINQDVELIKILGRVVWWSHSVS